MKMKAAFVWLASAALVFGSAGRADADAVLFNPSGTGNDGDAALIDVLDPAPGNALSIDLNAGSTVGSEGILLFQANLASALLGDDPAFGFTFGSPGNPAFTIVAGFTEVVTASDGVGGLTFGAPVTDGSLQGFFYIYAQTSNGSNLGGECFVESCGGTLILSGQIINNTNFFGNFDTNLADPVQTLDQSPNGDDWGGTQTVTGGGNFRVDIEITGVNAGYFPFLVPGSSFIFATSQQQLPFLNVDPTTCFSDDGIESCNQLGVGSVGAVNGLGSNTILQTDANLSFQAVSEIPEPATLTLLGLGLLGGAAARRRQMKAKKQQQL